MISPVCDTSRLKRHTLDAGIVALKCPESNGLWIRPSAYWRWRETNTEPDDLVINDSAVRSGEDLPINDSVAGKRCPEDGAFLIRHRVGHGLDFHIDRCGHCGGLWLDANEWEALQRHSFHDDLHLIFTSAWQAQVRQQQRQARGESLLQRLLGENDLQRAKQCRAWIDSHPQGFTILKFLNGEFDV